MLITVGHPLVYFRFVCCCTAQGPVTDRARCPTDMAVFPRDYPDFLTVGLAAGATDTGHLWGHGQCTIHDATIFKKQLTGILIMVVWWGRKIKERREYQERWPVSCGMWTVTKFILSRQGWNLSSGLVLKVVGEVVGNLRGPWYLYSGARRTTSSMRAQILKQNREIFILASIYYNKQECESRNLSGGTNTLLP